MRVFRVKMSSNDIDDSFYFNNLPSKEDVLSAIKANAELSPEYSFFYDKIEKAAEMFSWPEFWGRNMSETGSCVNFDSRKTSGSPDVYIRIKCCNVLEVKNG